MIYGFLIAFILGLVLNLVFVPLGKRLRLFKSHIDAYEGVSKLGGVAIFAAFLSAVFLSQARLHYAEPKLLAILGCLGLMFLLGLADDLLNLSATGKLIGQFIIALFLFFAGVKTQIQFLPAWANVALTILWLVAITNAFNLLDILDGLATGIAIVSCLTFWYMANLNGNFAAGVLAASLLGANLAFFKFNFFPAKLYMGDSGSLFNGFSLAAIAIIISYAPAGREVALFAPLLILALPVYDLLFVVVMRLVGKRPITKKSKDHFALRLITHGLSAQRVVLFMYALNCLFSLAAVFLLKSPNAIGVIVLTLAVFIWIFIAYKISRISIHES